jgi:HEAT repeat protein
MQSLPRLALALTTIGILGFLPSARAASVSEDEKLLREAKVPSDGPGLLDFFRKRTLSAEQRRQVKALLPRLGDDNFHTRQQASAALVAIGPPVLAHLRRALDHPDEEVKERLHLAIGALEKDLRPGVAAAAARLLRARAPAGAVPVLLAYLPDAEDESVVDEALQSLAALGVTDGKVAGLLAEALGDPEPACRAAAGLVLGRYGTTEQRTAVRSLLTDTSATVRFRTAQGLLALRDRAALPVLAALAADAPMPLAVRADELLAAVAAAQAPRVFPAEDTAGRTACRNAWKAWVQRSGQAALARAEVELPPVNASLRAAAAARHFALIVQKGEFDSLKEVADAPFLVAGENVIEHLGDLTNPLAPFLQLLRDSPVAGSVAAVRFPTLLPRGVSPAGQQFLARLRRGETRAVELVWHGPDRTADPVVIVLVVRLRGDRARVVAIDVRR